VIIVVIHWKIHPDTENIRDFFHYWGSTLEINDRSQLVGEFLSEPLSRTATGFPCEVFGQSNDYASYFNIGMWATIEDFRRSVIEPFVGKNPATQPFEYEYRQRMVIEPKRWRLGNALLPDADSLGSK
jgi:hypothetical protein